MKLKTARTMKKHILSWYDQATGSDLNDGLTWYEDAQKFCEDIAMDYDMTTKQVASVVSILSPQVNWPTNKKNALNLIQNGADIKIFASGTQKESANNVVIGSYEIPISARKTYSFADNIANRSSDRATIDRHAVNVALNILKPSPVALTTKQYELVEKCYKTIANKLDIKPYQLQAIVWVTYKRIVGR